MVLFSTKQVGQLWKRPNGGYNISFDNLDHIAIFPKLNEEQVPKLNEELVESIVWPKKQNANFSAEVYENNTKVGSIQMVGEKLLVLKLNDNIYHVIQNDEKDFNNGPDYLVILNNKYDKYGFDRLGINRETGTPFNKDGFSRQHYEKTGLTKRRLFSKYQNNEKIRFIAVELLCKINGNKDIQSIILFLDDKDLYIRIYAIEALGRIGDQMAVPFLLMPRKEAENEDWENYTDKHEAIIRSLGMIGGEKALDYILSSLPDPNYGKILEKKCRIEADERADQIASEYASEEYESELSNDGEVDEDYLEYTYDRTYNKLTSNVSEDICLIAWKRGVSNTIEALEHMLSKLEDQEETESRATIMEALAKMGHNVDINTLKEKAFNNHKDIRTLAEHLLGPEYVPEPEYEDEESKFLPLSEELNLLDDVKRQDAIDYLMSLISNDYSKSIDKEKIKNIIDGTNIGFLLENIYKLNKYEFTYQLIKTLWMIGGEKVRDFLFSLLSDDLYNLRASIALAGMGDERAVEPLIGLIFDQDPYIKQIVIKSFETLNGDKALKYLLEICEAYKIS